MSERSAIEDDDELIRYWRRQAEKWDFYKFGVPAPDLDTKLAILRAVDERDELRKRVAELEKKG